MTPQPAPSHRLSLRLAALLVASVTVAGLLAGCASSPASPAHVEADLVTPGQWRISAATEHVLVWAHNAGGTATTVTPRLTGPEGAALPTGWSASFEPTQWSLAPLGAAHVPSKDGWQYPDWASGVATLTVAPGEPAGARQLVLEVGDARVPITVTVESPQVRTSVAGDEVRAHYEGTFQATGKPFDSGDIGTAQQPVVVAGDGTVKGFGFGLLGLRSGEDARLVVPPALGYGYDNPTGSQYEQFNGQWLVFNIRLTSFLK